MEPKEKIHQEFIQWFDDFQDNNILFMFKGDFNQELVNNIVVLIEGLPEVSEENIMVRNRMSGVIVECLQNICRHGESPDGSVEMKPGMLLVRKRNDEYVIYIGNNLLTTKVEKLGDYINKINSLDLEGLKKFHREILVNTELFGKYGADLGLINIARKANKPFEFNFQTVDDIYSFFSFEISISAQADE